jgi:hypothetical protein
MAASTPSTPPQSEKKLSRTSLQLGTSAAHNTHEELTRKVDVQDENARLANPLSASRLMNEMSWAQAAFASRDRQKAQ